METNMNRSQWPDAGRRGFLGRLTISGGAAAMAATLPPGVALAGAATSLEIPARPFPLARAAGALDVRDFGARGDGETSDTAAFNAALARGSNIFVPCLNEHTGQPYRFLVGGVVVESARVFGGGTIVKPTTERWALITAGDGSVIEGLRFRAQETKGQPSSDIRLGEGARNVRILECSFESPIYSAISADIDNALNDALLTYSRPVQGVLIAGNVFKGGYARPIYLHSVENLIIKGNIIRDSDYDAIRLRQADGYCLIEGNQIFWEPQSYPPDDQTRDGVDTLWAGRNLTIANNIIMNSRCMGLDIKGFEPATLSYGSNEIIIAHNQILQSYNSGISISAAALPRSLHDILVTGNLIRGCVVGRIVAGVPVGSAAGIIFKYGYRRMTVTDNFLIANHARGIFLMNYAGTSFPSHGSAVQVRGNTCVNNGYYDGDRLMGYGILASGVDGLIVTGNICEQDEDIPNYGLQAVGIRVDGPYAGMETTIVGGNLCRNNTTAQIVIDPS
jgi:hypothetical protein